MAKIFKILVFDRDKSFFRYFRNTLSDYKFIFYLDVDKDYFFSTKFDLILFIQEGSIDKHIMFFKIFEEGIPIIFATYEKISNYKKNQMGQIKNIKLIDMLESKTEIIVQLKKCLNDLNLVK